MIKGPLQVRTNCYRFYTLPSDSSTSLTWTVRAWVQPWSPAHSWEALGCQPAWTSVSVKPKATTTQHLQCRVWKWQSYLHDEIQYQGILKAYTPSTLVFSHLNAAPEMFAYSHWLSFSWSHSLWPICQHPGVTPSALAQKRIRYPQMVT